MPAARTALALAAQRPLYRTTETMTVHRRTTAPIAVARPRLRQRLAAHQQLPEAAQVIQPTATLQETRNQLLVIPLALPMKAVARITLVLAG